MSFANKFVKTAQRLLPSPFTLAILITFLTAVLALIFTSPQHNNFHLIEIATYWQKGFWELLKFTMQMMLILVLGHILALSAVINKAINQLLVLVKNTSIAAALVCFFTLCFAFFNWGLGLIFGAIFARKVGEYAKANNIAINYPLVGAAGYAGLMVWHGGLSGSAPLTIAGAKHSLVEKIGVISVNETVFSNMNITVSLALLIGLPTLLFFIAKKSKNTPNNALPKQNEVSITLIANEGAERLSNSTFLGIGTAIIFLIVAGIFASEQESFSKSLSLDFINFILFGLCILAHKTFNKFTQAAETAIVGSVGIMIQFPLYAGIMGIMKYSGLIIVFSNFFVNISSPFSFPFLTFLSAGIVNIFVPSGGGQWAVQGPIIIEAAQTLGVPIWKSVMALAYGDQVTNMLQPFWALPLLGITGLKAQEILPYTLLLMLAGIIIFCLGLAIF